MRNIDQCFEELEKKIGVETIDIRDEVCTYPECTCPFDMGVDHICFIGKKVEVEK